ncbi:MAG: HNH endonuclease signature motif containing protein [Vicinamibacterales bacterium]
MTDKAAVSTMRARAVTADQWGVPERNEAGQPVCRWCKGAVARPRRTFCSDPCVHEWKIRSSPWYVRRAVKKRDKGICRLCGFNVVKAHREWTRAKPPAKDRAARKLWRAARPRWEADHIIPVADGGGECGLENYRLLCRPCHVRVTVAWRALRGTGSQGPADATRVSGQVSDRSGSHGALESFLPPLTPASATTR